MGSSRVLIFPHPSSGEEDRGGDRPPAGRLEPHPGGLGERGVSVRPGAGVSLFGPRRAAERRPPGFSLETPIKVENWVFLLVAT